MHCESCYQRDVSVVTLTDEQPGMLSWSCYFLAHAPALVEMMKTRALEVALLKRVTFVWRSAAAVWPVSLLKQQPTFSAGGIMSQNACASNGCKHLHVCKARGWHACQLDKQSVGA